MLMNHTRVPKVDRRIANVSLYDNCAICLFVFGPLEAAGIYYSRT